MNTNDLIQGTENILAQSQELLKQPAVKDAVSGLLSWIGNKIFAGKKAKQERLALIEQQKANQQTINDLTNDIRSLVEDNEELQQELAEKVSQIQLLLPQSGTNTATTTGNYNQTYQGINSSTITSINQNHSGQGHNIAGDYVAGDKISGDKIINQ